MRPNYLNKKLELAAETIGRSLKIARKRRGWTIADTAKKVGVTPRTIGRIESGDSKVNFAAILAVISTLGLIKEVVDSLDPIKDIAGMTRERARMSNKKNQVKTQKYNISEL